MENKAAESTRFIEEPKKELMIGDWVRYVHSGLCIYRTLVKMTAERFFDCGLVRFEPIEVTPEILHKNGFECNMNVTENIECIARKDNLTVMLWCDDWMKVKYRDTFQWYSSTRYVHELQHALRLCGSSELADSFFV